MPKFTIIYKRTITHNSIDDNLKTKCIVSKIDETQLLIRVLLDSWAKIIYIYNNFYLSINCLSIRTKLVCRTKRECSVQNIFKMKLVSFHVATGEYELESLTVYLVFLSKCYDTQGHPSTLKI